jgi:hypothetical protein
MRTPKFTGATLGFELWDVDSTVLVRHSGCEIMWQQPPGRMLASRREVSEQSDIHPEMKWPSRKPQGDPQSPIEFSRR